MANRQGLTIIDNSTRYPLAIAKLPNKDGRDYSITPTPWEPGDPKTYWREELHPWNMGLGLDRFTDPSNYFGSTRTKAPRTYAKANADASFKGILVPPPKVNVTTNIAAQITKRTQASGGSNAAASSFTFSVPAGLVNNDFIVLYIASNDADPHTLAVTGFTALGTQQTVGNHRSRVFTKNFAGETGSYTVTTGGVTIDMYNYNLVAYQFANGSLLSGSIDAIQASTDSTSPYDFSFSPTTNSNDMIVGFFGYNSSTAITDPSGFTSVTQRNGTYNLSTSSAQRLLTTPTSIAANFTSASNADGSIWIVALIMSNPVQNTGNNISKSRNFNNKTWIFYQQFLATVDSSYNVTVVKVFDSAISDIEVFGNELFIALGYSTKMWKVDTSDSYTQASDNTYAGKLGTSGKNFWRSTSANQVSSCLTTPLTLTNWGTSYTVGNTTWDINSLIDYGGVIWVGKQDGFYAPDVNTDFWNQTPQLLNWPDINNCRGSFVAQGYLFAPSITGLIRIAQGESVIVGPNRPDYRFRFHTGIEWNKVIYLAVSDYSGNFVSSIIKMEPDGAADDGYIYHELVRLTGYDFTSFVITPYSTNPTIIIQNNAYVYYIKLGRGGGRDIDDSSYQYGNSWELETGYIKPNVDMSLVTGLLGVTIVCNIQTAESITSIQYKVENESSFHNLLDTQEGGGSMTIGPTSGYTAVTRYAPANTTGQFFDFFFQGTAASTPTSRTEVREMYAFGFVRPRHTDLIKIPIYADGGAVTGIGIRQGRTAGQTRALLNRWLRDGTQFTFELADYEESRTTRGRIVAVADEELYAKDGTDGTEAREAIITITIQRDDLAGTEYNA